MDKHTQAPERHPETTPRELLSVIWQQRKLFFIATPFFLAIAAFLAWETSHTFKASTLLSPVANSPGSGGAGGTLSAVASQFSGIASLAGIASPEEAKKWESIAVLQSDFLTSTYIKTNNLLPVLYRSKWDAARGAWRKNDLSYVPTLWQADRYFKKKLLAVTIDSKTSLVTLTITWEDAHQAAAWANGLVKATNDYLRAQAIDQSERNIAYLSEEAQKSDVIEAKQAVFAILESEMTKEMLARGNEEYAFKVLDPAVAPEKPAAFSLPVWLFFGLLMSLGFWLLTAFARIAWKI